MSGEDKNLKDSQASTGLIAQDGSIYLSYKKTNKLITALYMVTDILAVDEPLRHKLRSIGAEILSDVCSLALNPGINVSVKIDSKINEVLSFLDIASAINLISEMNYNILKKEFLGLKKSIEESTSGSSVLNGQNSLTEFLKDGLQFSGIDSTNKGNENIPRPQFTVIKNSANIGVQKGSTLMKALSDRTLAGSFGNTSMSDIKKIVPDNSFDSLKKERRNAIFSIIQTNTAGSTITDIRSKAKGALATIGEKTLQRELISMVKDGVLYKTGSKRWSRYFFKG